MDRWEAMDRIIPFGDEKLCWVMANGFSLMIQRLNVILKRWCEVEDPPDVQASDLLTWMKHNKRKKHKPKDPYMNPNQVAQVFNAWASRQ